MKAHLLVFILCFAVYSSATAVSQFDVIINEVAWMGTENSANNEWIELMNDTDIPISLEGWILQSSDGTPKISLKGMIPAHGFYMLERSDEQTLPTTADLIYTGALGNNGETLMLLDSASSIIDQVNSSAGWAFGDNNSKQTMERKTQTTWQTSQMKGGTPDAGNSTGVVIAKKTKVTPLLNIKKSDNSIATASLNDSKNSIADSPSLLRPSETGSMANPWLLFSFIGGILLIGAAIILFLKVKNISKL